MAKAAILVVALILLVVVIGIAYYSNKTADIATDYCTLASDCVPSPCCHPDKAVNIQYTPDCSAVICDASCQGPLDCGVGKIECISNECTIVPNR